MGERAALVPLGPEHVEPMMELMLDEEAARLTGSHDAPGRSALEAWCGSCDDVTDRLDFAVLDATDLAFVGDLAVMDLDEDNRSCSFRIALLERSAGRGIGTEAIEMMVDHVLGLGLHRIALEVYDHNPRARHVYERCGFVHEGVLRHALRWDGEWIDAHVTALLADERRS